MLALLSDAISGLSVGQHCRCNMSPPEDFNHGLCRVNHVMNHEYEL